MKNFEMQLKYFSASTLRGIKPACLLPVQREIFFAQMNDNFRCFKIFEISSLKMKIVPRTEKIFLLFVYNENLLKKIWSDERVKNYFAEKNYPSKNLNEVLNELFRRLSDSSSFPHEIGIFLGYPLEDVAGYEKYGGRNAKFNGSWAVYGDVEKSRRLMELYRAS